MAGIPKSVLFDQVSRFCTNHELEDKEDIFKKGALVAQSPHDFENISELDEDDKSCLRAEINRQSTIIVTIGGTIADAKTDPWRLPRGLYYTIALCSLGSAIQ